MPFRLLDSHSTPRKGHHAERHINCKALKKLLAKRRMPWNVKRRLTSHSPHTLHTTVITFTASIENVRGKRSARNHQDDNTFRVRRMLMGRVLYDKLKSVTAFHSYYIELCSVVFFFSFVSTFLLTVPTPLAFQQKNKRYECGKGRSIHYIARGHVANDMPSYFL